MSFLGFLSCYYLLFVIASFAIVGWFVITRGKWESLPDGSRVAKGKVFKYWNLFFVRVKGRRKVYYAGSGLEALHDTFLKTDLVNLVSANLFRKYHSDDIQLNLEQGRIEILAPSAGVWPLSDKDILHLQSIAGVLIEYVQSGPLYFLRFYKEEDVYVFPEWIRMPLASCVTCFASIYGSLFYWSVLLQKNMFAWSEHPAFSMYFFWVVFCLGLSVLNTAIYNRMKGKD